MSSLSSCKIWFKAHFLITVPARSNYNLRLRDSFSSFYDPAEMQQFVVAFWDDPLILSLSPFPSASPLLCFQEFVGSWQIFEVELNVKLRR